MPRVVANFQVACICQPTELKLTVDLFLSRKFVFHESEFDGESNFQFGSIESGCNSDLRGLIDLATVFVARHSVVLRRI